jgi:hypothetical protein
MGGGVFGVGVMHRAGGGVTALADGMAIAAVVAVALVALVVDAGSSGVRWQLASTATVAIKSWRFAERARCMRAVFAAGPHSVKRSRATK